MKTCKKLLAIALVAVMLVSTLVSGLAVSAAEIPTLSVVVANTTITAGQDATVDVTVTSDKAVDALHMLATVESTLPIDSAAIKSVDYATQPADPSDPDLESPALKIEADNLAEGKILFGSGVQNYVAVNSVVFTLTFKAVAEGNYDVKVNIASTDYNEAAIPATEATGKITANAEVTHTCEYESVVTVEATKDAEGVRTFTCAACGNTYTEAIAKPELYTDGSGVGGTMVVADKFAYRLGTYVADTKKFANYKLVVKTQYYEGDNYVITDKVTVFTDEDKTAESTATRQYFNVYAAAYAVDFDIEATVYYYNEAGDTLYYLTKTYNIAERTIKYVKDNVAAGKLDDARFFMDMLNYCAAAQAHFKTESNGLKDAVLVNEGMDDYQQYASESAPDYNSIKINDNKLVDDSIAKIGKTVIVGDSNYIRYNITLPAGSTGEGLQLKVTYRSTYTNKDPQYPLIVKTVNISDLPVEGGKPYLLFTDAALYDTHVAVKAEIIKDGNTVVENDYNIANFIAGRISNVAYANILTAMSKFANSAKEYFGYDV